jgi:hypothetical protein
MKRMEGKLAGILGTVIIHLIAGIIFMSFQIKSLQKASLNKFVVEFAAENVIDPKVKQIELPSASGDKVLMDDPEMLNIVRNLSDKSDQKINRDEYIDKVKEELIKSGKLGINNYIDEHKRMAGVTGGDENIASESDSAGNGIKEKPEESKKISANYKGPTRIYYDLPGRTHTVLPIPIYLCQGSGKAVLLIEVNQKGEVEKAQIIERESTASDPCLIETAIQTALISRFNADVNSPRIQTGTLSYIFVAQ